MSDDLIKRSDAIKAFDDVFSSMPMEQTMSEKTYRVQMNSKGMPNFSTAVEVADRSQEWIPCSERLPREEEQDDELGVLVTLGNGYSGLQYDWYHGDHWYDWDGYVLAWMPLPKPWKGADDAKEGIQIAERQNSGI